MTRKDSEKEAERPRYYSQFWLDVAAGRRVIGAPKPDEGAEGAEPETLEAVATRKPGRTSIPVTDGYRESHSRIVPEPMLAPDEVIEPEPGLVEELAGEVDDLDIPNILVEEAYNPESTLEEEEVPAEDFYEDEEEEEEEELEWTGRGRKKPKPGRQVKQPKKSIKRDQRRGY